MGFFSFMETSFFFTLGITFLLILLLVYHFKQRIVITESKQDTMFEIINNLVQEINNIKTSVALMNRPPTPYPRDLQNVFRAEPQIVSTQHDEPDQESQEYDSDDEEDIYSDEEDEEDEENSNNLVIVSDNEDNISIEEISNTDDIEYESIVENQELEEMIQEEKIETPDFNKMNLGNLKSYILKQGWVEDASKMKKAQILTLIQEHSA